MRGVVNRDLNERVMHPSVNAPISGYYKSGDVVEIAAASLGDKFDEDDLWYELKNGAFVWNGAVDIEPEFATNTNEDKEQFLISYRRILSDGRPDMFTQQPPDELYFMPVLLPAREANIRFNNLIPGNFADGVLKSIDRLHNPSRRHVFIYIHGFQPFSSLKLDLFNSFVQNYLNNPSNKIAKVLFMIWPSQGLSRKRADDRAISAGENFTANNLFEPFRVLSEKLKDKGMFLNLVVHSFGHQLVNGMLNPFIPNNVPAEIFENIFLMASDVTHLAMSQSGITLRNNFGQNDTFTYDYNKLKTLGKNVHVFYDEFDYLLYASTKKFVGGDRIARRTTVQDRRDLTNNYRNLGNYGKSEIKPPFTSIQNINVQSVQDLITPDVLINLCDFPWLPTRENSSFRQHIKQVIENADYEGIKTLKIIFNQRRLQNYHQYVFTCKPVVDAVQRLLV
ncbi:alpha/beta hydrolase [Dyadobacter sp. MSC1_007]|jgi:hypothetical protein|uniref:alpha/beta hydrolase n=1 Tax=Dyadobacter sp. MSC1_007 TaxID=2909264 RepID=UPI0020301FA2|nr:alpha/beta hydrolase [Dyadobacter sp. MSC1_007]